MTGTVYLVGAGPGAPDLLTLRAARLLEQADIVFHDALVHPDTIALAARAEKVAVGKRCGRHSTAQQFINKRLVDAAKRHRVVVRLKGGDPMMFGRAQEEIALVREQVLRTVEATPLAEGRQPRLVMITSTRSGEGKTFVALNLAASIAEGAHRPVILVDANRGADSLTSLLGLRSASGLEQLRDTDDPDPVGLLRRTEVPDLFVLPYGTAQPSGGRGSAMAGALLHLAGRLTDHIILIDAPACLESSIAGLLAGAAGQIALVVEAERTKRAEVEAALDILDACPTLQLLLNRSALQVSDGFRGSVPNSGDVAVGAHQA